MFTDFNASFFIERLQCFIEGVLSVAGSLHIKLVEHFFPQILGVDAPGFLAVFQDVHDGASKFLHGGC